MTYFIVGGDIERAFDAGPLAAPVEGDCPNHGHVVLLGDGNVCCEDWHSYASHDGRKQREEAQ